MSIEDVFKKTIGDATRNLFIARRNVPLGIENSAEYIEITDIILELATDIKAKLEKGGA